MRALDSLTRARRGLFYGWWVTLGGAASNFLVIGIVAFGFGVFVQPLRDEMGWSVAAISAGVSLRSAEQGLLAPLTGMLVDRLGPRRMAVGGMITLVVGLVLFSQARSLTAFYASSLVIALGQSTASFTPFSVAVVAWFRRLRGRAMGILNTGNGAGYLATPVLAYLVAMLGWREALLVAAGAIAIVGLPLTTLLRDTPEERGLHPDGDAGAVDSDGTTRARSSTGASVKEALCSPAFYLLVLATTANASQGAWIVHQVPHLQNVGYSTRDAAFIVAAYGLIQVSLRVAIGWVGDSLGRKRMYAASFVFQGVGMLAFAQLAPGRPWLLVAYFAIYATGHAAWVVFQQTMVADYFGVRRFATLRGLSGALQTPLGVLTPWLAGWMFDQVGDYRLIFTVYGFAAMTGALFVTLIRRPLWIDEQENATPRAATA